MFEELKQQKTRMRVLKTSLAAIAVCEASGIAGGLASSDDQKTWFPKLEKPDFNPPSWVFAPVWTLLYALMGISAATMWRARDDRKREAAATRALGIFSIQLALNALWTFIFFEFRSPKWAFVDIIALLVALTMTIVAIAKVSRPAALLLAPYLAWTLFAAVLNGSIWRMNRT
jgi:tryptophan-rich sensory protein